MLSASEQQGLSFSWDGRGNQTGKGTQTFGYDSANRLTAANTGSGGATYAYDGEGIEWKGMDPREPGKLILQVQSRF